jgi:hypothetical protein
MTIRRPVNEKKNPTVTNTRPRSSAMNLINEALARARMRSPQNRNSEARRSARRIAMQARHQQARELGNLSQFGIR